jgi:hypothetical protein
VQKNGTMNTSEGLRRVAAVIRFFGYGVAALLVAGSMVVLFIPGARDALALAGIGLVCAAASAGTGWGLAWIVDGFAKERPP